MRRLQGEIPGSYGLDASHKGGEDEDHDAADARWGPRSYLIHAGYLVLFLA